MTSWVKFAVIFATIGFSACVVASPTQTTSAEGQVMSVTAIDVSALPANVDFVASKPAN